MSEEIGNGAGLRPSGSVISRLLGIFYEPGKVFADVDRGARWWEPWLWVSLVNMIVAYIVIPIQVQLYRLREGQLPQEQFELAIEKMQAAPIKYLGIVTAPVTVLIVGVLFASVSFIAVSALSERANFKKHLTICLWGSLVWWVGVLVSTVVVRARGIEEIRTFRDAMAPFGPAAFVAEGHKVWLAVLSTLDLFALWFYALVALGAVRVFRISWRAAILVVAPVWLLYVLFELISARLSGGP
jgi:hypothetical protein